MKKLLIAIILSLIVLVSCNPKEMVYTEPSEDKYVPNTTPSKVRAREKWQEIKIGNIQDMKIFNNELYFVTTDKYASATFPSIYKYIDDKAPPINLFDFTWQDFTNKLTDLNSLEEVNGELYAGGPMGIFKLDEQSNKFKKAEFSYGFNYAKEYGISVTLIRAVRGKLYAILTYATSEENVITALTVLEGNTWNLVTENSLYNLHGIEDLREHNGEFYVGGYSGGVSKLDKSKWVSFPTEEPYDLARFILLESYNGKLYACGESSQYKKGNTYSLEFFSIPEDVETNWYDIKTQWKLALDYKDTCTFIKKANGKLYVGADEWYDPLSAPQNVETIKSLHVFDGKEWKSISFVNAPGLSKGQVVMGATAIEYFNNKLFIAVKTNYDQDFELQPSMYTLDNNGVLAPITWWKE